MNNILTPLLKNLADNKRTTALLGGVVILLVGWSAWTGTLAHLSGYLLAILLSVLVVEYIHVRRPFRSVLPIRKPERENVVVLAIIALQYAVSILRFVVFPDFQSVHPGIRLAIFALMILVIYPVALVIYFIGIRKYKLSELGLRFDWRIAVAVIVITILGSMAVLVRPEGIRFTEFFANMGLTQMLVLGFLSAAFPEELMRVVLQSRLGSLFNNRAMGWFLTGLLWAGVHIPNFYSRENELGTACIAAMQILPIGLLWGYMTDRFKSIWPSVIVHGTNLWGLQDF